MNGPAGATQRGAASDAPELPSGLVTFVFTDIEESTRLLTRVPDLAPELFERHDEIIRRAIEAHGGFEMGHEGDAFFAAFADVDDALDMCATAQRLLAAEPWPQDEAVRVRIGVHAGPAAPRNGNYFSLCVHQAARIVGVAHGGQIVISEDAFRRLGRVPSGTVTSLGRFRVRDFDDPQTLHRLDAEGLSVVDRSVRATPESGHNIVRPPTSFVDREDDVAAISAQIAPGQIISLVGPGGVGKSRLAAEIGLRSVDAWPDGVWMVELADVTDSATIAAEIADVLPVRTEHSDEWATVRDWARERSALLIVDNVERHVETCATLLEPLVADGGLSILTTGQQPLGIRRERVRRIEPFEVPDVDGSTADIASAHPIALFRERAAAAGAVLNDDDATLRDIARLCARLDGIALAIEIAASRAPVVSLPDMLDGLDRRFELLHTNLRDVPTRQRTLAGLLSWSYDLLTDEEQIAFRRLAVFAGSFTFRAAESALDGDGLDRDEIAGLLWSLVDKSLLTADPTSNQTRYRMLESVQAFADRLLDENGDGESTSRRLASSILEDVGPWRPADRAWISTAVVELPNIRGVLARTWRHDPDTAQALVCTIARLHDVSAPFQAAVDEIGLWVDVLDAPTQMRVAMLTRLADLCLRSGDTQRASELVGIAADLRDEVGPPPWNDVAVERTQGEIELRSGNHPAAGEIATAALERGLSDLGQARMWNLLGLARYSDGDHEGAAEAFDQELELWTTLGSDSHVASANGNLAEMAMHREHPADAARYQLQCLELALTIGHSVMLAYSALVAGRIAASDGDWKLAVRLTAAGDQELSRRGHRLYEPDQQIVDQLHDTAAERLGREAAERSRREGQELPIVEAMGLARALLAAATTDQSIDTENPRR